MTANLAHLLTLADQRAELAAVGAGQGRLELDQDKLTAAESRRLWLALATGGGTSGPRIAELSWSAPNAETLLGWLLEESCCDGPDRL